jgi:hypothetical protein
MRFGMLCRLAGNSLWGASQHFGPGIVTPVAPQDVAYAISYSLLAALDTERRRDREEALEMFGRALTASREAEFRISRPYDELSAMRGESPPGAADFLRQRLRKFEEYFGVKIHDDIQASLEVLNPAETAALLRVFVEAFWNVAKHSDADNAYLESCRLSADRPRSGRRPRLRHEGTAAGPRSGVHAQARRGGRRGSGRDLHPWTRDFGAGKVPQAQEHRQPVAGRCDRLHEQNVAGNHRGKEPPRDRE